MKRSLIILFLVFGACHLKAQTYAKLTDSALHVMWKAKDTVGERQALNLYEKAFSLYPKEIENLGLYKASALAGDLLELDKAFKYLAPVAKAGLPNVYGWKFIAGDYYESEYANLLKDKRWTALFVTASAQKKAFFDNLKARETDFNRSVLKGLTFNKNDDGKKIYQTIKNFNAFTEKKYQNFSVTFKVTDSLSTSYFVNLPKNYDPRKRYALLFFLHGAVQGNAFAPYQEAGVLEGWNRFYTKYAGNVIMVYPQGSRKYNWMNPDDGFFIIPAILKQIKQAVNIDDDKVFITGHSNGATGSFSYLMKQQSPFAGFYGFNTQPKVRTGGTFIRNILNRSYFNVSTDEDYYFPPDANDTLNKIMKHINADYKDHRYNGFPHWFPQFDESEPVYPILFKDLNARKRDPFHKNIYWACDDVKYGKADWLQINQLDTLNKPAVWHKNINFNILKLVNYDQNKDLVTTVDTLLKAFNFPRRSGAVKGYFKNNEFHMEVSAVKAFSIFISPEMVDMTKPVVIYVNGVKKVTKKPSYNKTQIINDFKATYDRKAVWVDRIDVELTKDI